MRVGSESAIIRMAQISDESEARVRRALAIASTRSKEMRAAIVKTLGGKITARRKAKWASGRTIRVMFSEINENSAFLVREQL